MMVRKTEITFGIDQRVCAIGMWCSENGLHFFFLCFVLSFAQITEEE